MKEQDPSHPIDLLKELPTEIDRQRIEKMISGFPLVSPPTDWSSFINLNTLLMTSIGAVLIAGTIGFFINGSSATTTERIERSTPTEQSAESTSKAEIPEENIPQTQPPSTETHTDTAGASGENAATGALSRDGEDLAPLATLPPTLDSANAPSLITPEMENRVLPPVQFDEDENRQTFDLRGFVAVALKGSVDIQVTQGPWSVVAEGDDEDIDKLSFTVDNNTLSVSLRKNGNWSEYKLGENVIVHVSLPELERLMVTGSGDLRLGVFEGMDDLRLDLSGSGNMVLDKGIDMSGELDINLAGSGDMTIAGRAQAIDISLAGSGDINAKDLQVRQADVSIAGSGDVSISCSEQLDASIMGSGDIDYYGNPRVKSNVLGSGDVSGH